MAERLWAHLSSLLMVPLASQTGPRTRALSALSFTTEAYLWDQLLVWKRPDLAGSVCMVVKSLQCCSPHPAPPSPPFLFLVPVVENFMAAWTNDLPGLTISFGGVFYEY